MEKTVKARPAVLRALGKHDPPVEVTIDGEVYQQRDIFKHDSWAATGLYDGSNGSVVCKFNRKQSIYGLPMQLLGRFLAARETFAYSQFSHIEGITAGCGDVIVDGAVWPNATAHHFMPGHPLGHAETVDDQFFPRLLATLKAVHDCGFAYVDLHKRENILVGESGQPFLIDFQISYYADQKSWLWPISRHVLNLLQKSDLYHLSKHVKRIRPDQLEQLGLAKINERPWWIKAHRTIAVPFRQTRRWLLTQIGVRGKSGRSTTEVFAEHAFRDESKKAA